MPAGSKSSKSNYVVEKPKVEKVEKSKVEKPPERKTQRGGGEDKKV